MPSELINQRDKVVQKGEHPLMDSAEAIMMIVPDSHRQDGVSMPGYAAAADTTITSVDSLRFERLHA